MENKIKRISSAVVSMALAVTAFGTGFGTSAEITASAVDFDPNNATVSQIITDMGVGWNLGNALDATGGGNTLSSETSWGNPKTTKAMIDAIRNKGFDTVRIPVSWTNHTTGDDYEINEAWLDRVREVVDYAYDEGMYVILNIHHDNGDGAKNYYPDSENYDKSEKIVSSLWTQIAKEFSSYDDHLIFETLNEPRLTKNARFEWDGGSRASVVKDARNCITKLNQSAVNAIRSNDDNKDRMIMVPGYAASLEGAIMDEFKIPTDISGNTNRIAVSIHGYRPYDFAMQAEGGKTAYDSAVKQQVEELFTSINTNFTSKGINVVIGETGATNKDNSSARVSWATDYLELAKKYNVACCLWDNNWFGTYVNGVLPESDYGENFGILNRKTLEFFDEAYTQALVDAYEPKSISTASCSVSTQEYTGKAIKPNVTVRIGATTLVKNKDYTISYSNNTAVGKARYTITGIGNYCGTKSGTFSIKKGPSSLKFASISAKKWTGSAIKPNIVAKDGTTKLVNGVDYTIKYSNNTNVGTATAKVVFKGNYTGTKTFTFKITPKKQTVKAIKAVKNGVKLTYVKHGVATGYQIKYSTKSDMSDVKTVWVKSGKTTTKTISNLKSGTKYYFKVRTYTTVNGQKVYGEYSAKKSCVAK